MAGRYLPALGLAVWLLLFLPLGQASAAEGIRSAIRHLSVAAYIEGGGLVRPNTLYELYRERHFQPLWLEGDRAGVAAETLLAALRGAASDGLAVEDYPVTRLTELLGATDVLALAELDLLLTDSYLNYSSDLATGRLTPQQVDPDWHIRPSALPLVEWLQQDLAQGRLVEGLNDLAPYRGGYRRLKRALAEYRAIAAAGGWEPIAEGETLRPGDRGPRVAELRRRLAVSGDLSAGAAEQGDYFDALLRRAVVRFQTRHGLQADGDVGPKSRAALNVPVATRLQQIIMSMERWRWLPHRPEPRYLLVNMAGYELYAIDTAQREMTLRIIIGKSYRQTPVFSSELKTVIVNPYWYVPTTILQQDILPRLRRDPGYLQRGGFRVFSDLKGAGTEVAAAEIDWASYGPGEFPYILRQDAGGGNALGRLKFMMDNPYGIYLHDTPNRALFARSERALSSGCIRVEQPNALAEFLLASEPEGQRQMRSALAGERPQRIDLEVPLPIYLVYWTAWVDDRGAINFRDDVYGRDWLLLQALQQHAVKGRLSALSIDSWGSRGQ